MFNTAHTVYFASAYFCSKLCGSFVFSSWYRTNIGLININNSIFYTVYVALIVSLDGFLMGFDASVISGVVKFIEP